MLFQSEGNVRELNARGTRTLEITTPFVTEYVFPRERVLFDPRRDANPFFHLFESLWIISEWNDVKTLAYFLPNIRDYSDDTNTFHGAYGFRMRMFNQIKNVVKELRRDQDSRRAVIALWIPSLDAGYRGKDMPCNTTLYFKIREGALNLTICNRSNDMIWGAYGANAVQFSIVQEYVASMVGVRVGYMYQFSDSFHIYPDTDVWKRCKEIPLMVDDPYDRGDVTPAPLVDEPSCFWLEVHEFMIRVNEAITDNIDLEPINDMHNSFITETALPMFNVLRYHKQKDTAGALIHAESIQALDWQLAVQQWLQRRLK